MFERRYKDMMYELNEKRESLVAEISALEDEMINQKPIFIEQYFDGIVKGVENLSFTEKKAIIKKVIIKMWQQNKRLALGSPSTVGRTQRRDYK